MHKAQEQVEEFHRAMNQTIGTDPDIRDAKLRASLILEEALETVTAIVGSETALHMLKQVCDERDLDERHFEPDLVQAIDGLADILYVVYGSAVSFGIDLEPFFEEVHFSNLAKANGPVRADGKRLKPEGWRPPRIAEILTGVKNSLTG